MHWKIDRQTVEAATKYPFPIRHPTPVGPFKGRRFVVSNWNHRVLQPADWEGVSRSDPEEIIRQFGKQKYTQALALVVSWGTMWRQPNAVWGDRELGKIDSLLRECSESIRQSESIEESWRELVNHLGWSSVLISKTLHFLCLSLGFKHDPPVPIDGDVIRGKVWPVFIHPVPLKERPKNWTGDSFEAYSRYMSAILTWAEGMEWTTSDVERTISVEVEPSWDSSSS